MRIVLCDRCGVRIQGGVVKLVNSDEDLCFDCSRVVAPEEACQHEDNISDAVPGRTTARLVCKACGYDRVEEVA